MRHTMSMSLSLGVVTLAVSAFALPDPVKWWASKSDQYIWEWIPDLKVHGIAHGTWGCPVCGKEIFEGRGHYPWIWHPDRPYKVQCPICKGIFPTNDYHRWMLGGRKEELDTKQKYVDDGDGYVGPDGTRYLFIKYALGEGYKTCIWVWTFRKGLTAVSQRYADTGDETCAHKCALIMARVATEYPRLNPHRPYSMTLEDIKKLRYRRPPNRRLHTIGGYQRESSYMCYAVTAYRRLYPYLEKGGDPDLKRFLADKGIEDVEPLIKWDLCHQMILGALEGNFISGSGMQGLHIMLAKTALAWDLHDPAKGATSEYLLDWIRHTGPRCVEDVLHNEFDRDGFNATPSMGYQFGGGIAQIARLAEALRAAGLDLYAIPRVREIIRAPIKPVVAGQWYPAIADAGKWTGFPAGGYWRPDWMGPLFAATGDPLLAKALANSPRGAGDYRDRVAEVVAKVGRELTWESRNYPILGLAIFESGEGHFRRGLSCYYGGTTAHGRFDRLTFNLFNRRGPVTPGLGYPHMSSPERREWTANTAAHNTVVVDAQMQLNREPGHINMFAVAPSVQALEVDGKVAYRGMVSKYRRTLVWVDVDATNSYLVDVFRVAGGSQHDYSLHGGSGRASAHGLALTRQERGTLAGPDVKHRERYDDRAGSYGGSGFQYLYNVEKSACRAGFLATWDHWQERTPFLRVHVPAGTAEQALFADALPPFGKGDDALRYMFLRNGSCPPYDQQYKDGKRVFPVGDRQSTFVTVLEPIYDERFVTRVGRLTGLDGLGDTDVALAIERADGATDLLVCLEAPSRVRVRGMALQGRIGLCTIGANSQADRLALSDGTLLSFGESRVTIAGPAGGVVRAVDYDAMTVTVSEELPRGDTLSGRTVIFSIPPRTAAFVIDSVQGVPEGSRIKLRDLDAVIFRGKVERADNTAATVILDSPVSILNSGTGMAGMRLYNEDRSFNVRIKSFKRRWDPNSPWPPFGGTARVESGRDLEAAFRDLDGDGCVLAYVYEFGPGDHYHITSTAYLEKGH